MQTSWNGDKTILQSIEETIATILQNTNVSMNSDVNNTTEIQNIKNSIGGISTNVQAIEGRDIYTYMLIKPTVAGGNETFKDIPTIFEMVNDSDDVEIMVCTCKYSESSNGRAKYYIDGELKNNGIGIFNAVSTSVDNDAYYNNNICKSFNMPIFESIFYNNSTYNVSSFESNDSNMSISEYGGHIHKIKAPITNYDINLGTLHTVFCTNDVFKKLRLKAFYYGSFLIVIKSKQKFIYETEIEKSNALTSIVMGGEYKFDDSTTKSNFKKYNCGENTSIYVNSLSVLIPPTIL